MAVLLDQNGLVPSLEQVAGPAMPMVKELSVDAIQLSHANGEIAVRGLDEKVVMVGHEAVSVADPVVPFVDVLKGIEEVQAVLVVFEDGFFLVPARGDVVDSTGIFDSERAGHIDKTLSQNIAIVNLQDVTL